MGDKEGGRGQISQKMGNVIYGQFQKINNTYCKDLAHYFFCFSANILAEIIERFQISFIQCITNNFNVHFIQILFINAFLKKWSYKKINSRSFFYFSLILYINQGKRFRKKHLYLKKMSAYI